MKINNRKHSNLFLKYFVYYSTGIIIILLILGFFLNQFVISKFLKFSENEYANILSTKCTQIEVELNAIKTTAIRLQNLSVGTPYNICENPSDKINAIKELELLTTINPSIENIALCYACEPNNIISVPGTMTMDSFASHYIDGTWDGKRLKSEIEQNYDARLLLTDSTINNKSNPQQFLLIAKMPFGQTENYGYVIFVLNNDFLTRTMEDNLKNYDFFIQISDEKNHSYLVNSDLQGDNLPTANDKLGNDYIILSQDIGYGFEYTIGIRKEQLYIKIEQIWRDCIIVLSIFSIVGVLLSFIIAEHLYRPIRKISEAIGIQMSSKDELQLISRSIGNLVTVKNKAENIIGDVKNQLFDNLLYHEIYDESSVTELLDFARVQFNYTYFCVVKLSFLDIAGEASEKITDLLILIEDNNDNHNIQISHITKLSDCICAVINTEDDQIDPIRQAFKELSPYNVNANISIGSVVSDIFKLHQSYEEATFVLSCDFFDDSHSIFTIEDATQKINNNYVYPKVEESKLISAILTSNVEQIKSVMQNILGKFRDEKINIKILWGIYVSMINNIKNALEIEHFNLIDMGYSIKKFTINDYSGYAELNDSFGEIITQFIAVSASAKKAESSNVIKSIYDYINTNFSSYNISLNAVANGIGLSPSYTTKLFKEATGYSVKEYVDMKKMQKAKELLKQTDLSLNEISQQIGFLDTQSFYRKFKTMEGVSPNSYKRNHI